MLRCSIRGLLQTPKAYTYTNPLAGEMDKKLLNASSISEVLALTVSHRGVLFVHNLVTALEMLATHVGDWKSKPRRVTLQSISKDERFLLLLHDLTKFANKLDTESIAKVTKALRVIDCRHYPLLTGLTKRTIAIISSPNACSLNALMQIGETLSWAGYGGSLSVFRPLAEHLAKALSSSSSVLVSSLRLFGTLPVCHLRLYDAALPSLRTVVDKLSGRDLAIVAQSLASQRVFDERTMNLMGKRAVELLSARNMRPSDAVKFVQSQDKLEYWNMRLIDQIARRQIMPAIQSAIRARETMVLMSMEDFSSFFKIASEVGSLTVEQSQQVFDYLSDQGKRVTENSAIDFLSCVKHYPEILTSHTETVKLLGRKVARGTNWEKRKCEVFELWLSCRLIMREGDLFPALRRSFLFQCYRSWLLHRGGVYTEENRRLEKLMSDFSPRCQFRVHVSDSPFTLDALLSDNIAIVLMDYTHVGFSKFQVEYLKSRGFQVIAIPRRWLKDNNFHPKLLSTIAQLST